MIEILEGIGIIFGIFFISTVLTLGLILWVVAHYCPVCGEEEGCNHDS